MAGWLDISMLSKALAQQLKALIILWLADDLIAQ